MINDPGKGLATRAERRTARLAVWVPWWTNATATQKKDRLWEYFLEWYQGVGTDDKLKLQSKVRVLMGNPSATLPEMKTFVQDNLSAQILGRAIEWLS